MGEDEIRRRLELPGMSEDEFEESMRAEDRSASSLEGLVTDGRAR